MSLAPDGQEVKTETLYAVVHKRSGRVIYAFYLPEQAEREAKFQRMYGVPVTVECREMEVYSVKGIRP